MHDDGFGAFEAGTAYALFRHGQDRQARQLAEILETVPPAPQTVDVHVHVGEDEKPPRLINNLDYSDLEPVEWDDYVGQEPLKTRIMVSILAAKRKGEAMPHTLLASGSPGVGKTMMARLIAKQMGASMIELVPPFNVYTLAEAAMQLCDHDVLFIDEIHKLADSGKRGAEILLKVLEDKVMYLPDGTVEKLNDITIIGATTDRDMLPETVVDRFKVKPYFQPYTLPELARITIQFAAKHDALGVITDDLGLTIAKACRSTPRVCEEMVMAAADLALAYGREVSPAELLQFVEVTADGLTRTHVHYLTALYQYFKRERTDGHIEYIVGEAAMQQILRETKQGIGRLERFLVERGLIDRTPRGRRLTERGIKRAKRLITQGLGAADVA